MQKHELQEWMQVLEYQRSTVLGHPMPSNHDIIEHVEMLLKKYTTGNGDFVSRDEFDNIIKNDPIQIDFFKILGVITQEDLLFMKFDNIFENDSDLLLQRNKNVPFQ